MYLGKILLSFNFPFSKLKFFFTTKFTIMLFLLINCKSFTYKKKRARGNVVSIGASYYILIFLHVLNV